MNYADALGDVVRGALRQILGEAEGFLRPAKQTRPIGRVAQVFGTVLIESLGQRGTPVVRRGAAGEDKTDAEYILDAYDEFEASVQFFRARPKAYDSDAGTRVDAAGLPEQSQWSLSEAQHLVKSLWLPQSKIILNQAGLGFQRVKSGPRDLTALQDSVWESRAQVSLEFGIANRQVARVALLTAVQLVMKYSPPGGVVVSTTIEV